MKVIGYEEERVCPECGGALHQCGQSVARRELVYVPAQYKVVEHIQAVYSCRCCEQKNDKVPMKKGTVPAPLIPGSGIVSPSLLAHIFEQQIYAGAALVPAGTGAGPAGRPCFPPDYGELGDCCV